MTLEMEMEQVVQKEGIVRRIFEREITNDT